MKISGCFRHLGQVAGAVLFAGGLGFLPLCSLWAQAAQYSQPTIVGSRHDLAWAYHRVSEGFHPWDDYNQICIFCHTPHHADQSQGPLWNRLAPVGPYTLYQSPTLPAPYQPGPTSLLCLSCHDGTMAVDLVLVRPLYSTGTSSGRHGAMTTAGTNPWINCGTYCHGSGGWHDARPTFIGTNLADDHPVGVNYPASGSFVPAPPDGRFPNGVHLTNGRVECDSCHDPHDPTKPPFLLTSNESSALCYTCHVK